MESLHHNLHKHIWDLHCKPRVIFSVVWLKIIFRRLFIMRMQFYTVWVGKRLSLLSL